MKTEKIFLADVRVYPSDKNEAKTLLKKFILKNIPLPEEIHEERK